MWNTIILEPMINSLLYIYSLLGQNFGWAIIVFTALVRLITLPLTIQQMRSTMVMQEIQGVDVVVQRCQVDSVILNFR